MTREMKKRSEPVNGMNSGSDNAKKVYRAALEAIKCLEKINQEKKAYREVFRQDAVGLRNKLKDYCERLMFYNPLEYGRKAEEVLWRKVFYDVIQVVKKSRDRVRHHGSVDTAYRTHLSAAVGYYQHLVFRLQREFSLKLAGVIDYYQLPDPRTGRRGDTSSAKSVSPSIQEWAQRACHRCLICLGDISRYICDVDRIALPAVSDRYYHQAFMLFPEIGMPHNQLGTLAGSRYCGCEAAYHYLRCLACEKPFEGASGNLTRLFEKNTKKFFEINKSQTRDLPPDKQKHQDMKRFFTSFLKMIEIFHGASKSVDMHELQQLCQQTLQDFNLCMFYEPHPTSGQGGGLGGDQMINIYDPGDPISLQYFDNSIVFKIICCLICNIQLLDKNGSPHSSAATAFLLALFSHILNHIILRLQGALEDMETPNKILLAGSSLSHENLKMDDSSGSDEETSATSTDKSGKNSKRLRPPRLRERRRRRRRPASSSSDEMSDLSDGSDLSEGDGLDADDHQLSSESENGDDLASYFDHGSDSDLSESEGGEKKKPGQLANKKNRKAAWNHNNNSSANNSQAPPLPNGDLQHIWAGDAGANTPSLAHMSEELFSSSLMFLGQDLTQESFYGQDSAKVEAAPLPPGFNSYVEAQHAADITEKLANFDIETDTDVMFTDTDVTDFVTEPEEDVEENDNSPPTNREKPEQQEQKRLQQMFEVVQGEGLLPTVKVMCDWMKCQPSIIAVCAQVSHTLWHRLSILLNFLPHENDIVQHEQCWPPELQVTATRVRFSDWSQVFPLAEDIEMCQLSPLSEIHSQVDFTTKHRAQLSSLQETFLRICCLRRFGYFLTSLDNIEFSYQPETAMFFGPSTTSEASGMSGGESNSLEKMRDTENRRNQLMRDMAQLRLQAEVRELEGSVQSSDSQAQFPPYVLVDAEALCANLTKIKELADTARCIVVIPLAVVDRLDFQKKESSSAREAIRWLEAQLRKGNRYIRAQKAKERLSAQKYGHLKKKNREAWYMVELVSCGRYLAQQSGSFNTGHKVVVILTGHQHLTSTPLHPSIQSAKTAAEQEGVTVETVSDFFQKWKSVLQHQTGG